MYEVKLMNGDVYNITEEEARNIGGKSGIIPFPSIKSYLNTNSIVSVSPVGIAKNKNEQKEFLLKDGLRVFKDKFGTIRPVNNPEAKVDMKYYPEIAKNDLPINI